jgi:hypothetical protein
VRQEERARHAIRIDSRVDRLLENAVGRAVEIPQRGVVEVLGASSGIDVRGEQHLVGVHVAEPGDHVLVHERGLDRAAVARESFAKRRRVEIAGVGPELFARDEGIDVIDQADRAEHPDIDEREVKPLDEVEPKPRMRWRRGLVLEVPECTRHSEVKPQPAVPGNPREQVLAVTARLRELVTDQRRTELATRHSAQHATGRDLDVADAVMQRRGVQVLLEDLDIGQLGHCTTSGDR